MYDVIIVGAGASGSFLALTLKYNNSKLKVLLLEKNDKLGKKLLITGNGRCNLGNLNSNLKNYNSSSNIDNFKSILENIDNSFLNNIDSGNKPETYFDYLNKFGILIKKDEERLYPYSNQAISVCKSFERCIDSLNVEIKYNYDVISIEKENDVFKINNELKSKNVVIATGGKSYPKTGSIGTGYEILKKFGHRVTKLYPSLTNLKTDDKYLKDLAGVRVDAIVSLLVDNKILDKEEGQVQFTKDSLSGICVFNLSRNVSEYLKDKKCVKLIVNLVPDYNLEELSKYLDSFRNYLVEDAIACILNHKLAMVIAKKLKLNGRKISSLTEKETKSICKVLKSMTFNITETGCFDVSQVTNGGAILDEFTHGLESKKCKCLYAIGEVLDVDGKCGGYNLSWAFNSALIVCKDILKKILRQLHKNFT